MKYIVRLGPKWAMVEEKKPPKKLDRKARRRKAALWEKKRKERRLHILRTQVVPRLNKILKQEHERKARSRKGRSKTGHKDDLLFHAFQGGGFETNRRRH